MLGERGWGASPYESGSTGHHPVRVILVPSDVVDVGQDKFHPGLHQHHVSCEGKGLVSALGILGWTLLPLPKNILDPTWSSSSGGEGEIILDYLGFLLFTALRVCCHKGGTGQGWDNSKKRLRMSGNSPKVGGYGTGN